MYKFVWAFFGTYGTYRAPNESHSDQDESFDMEYKYSCVATWWWCVVELTILGHPVIDK